MGERWRSGAQFEPDWEVVGDEQSRFV